jgi:SAM-dependent methyltransferase
MRKKRLLYIFKKGIKFKIPGIKSTSPQILDYSPTSILNNAPTSTKEGTDSYIQSDRDLSICFNAMNISESIVVMWQGNKLETQVNLDDNIVTCTVPSKYYSSSGEYKIHLFDIQSGLKSSEVIFYSFNYAENLIPPLEPFFDGTTSQEEFKIFGENFLQHFLIDHCKIAPNARILDVGCASGQKARSLTKYLNDQGSYEGFDIVARGIEWCKKNYCAYPNFNFQLADIYSTHYNQRGKYKSSNYKFPYKDEEFDLVFLSSVFTHMLPQSVKIYFKEIARVLKRHGKCLITFFLLNPEALRRIEARLNTIKVPYKYNSKKCRIADKDSPETTVAYDEKFIRSLYDQNGLNITEITYGNWCGRKEFMGCLQDAIIVVKE